MSLASEERRLPCGALHRRDSLLVHGKSGCLSSRSSGEAWRWSYNSAERAARHRRLSWCSADVYKKRWSEPGADEAMGRATASAIVAAEDPVVELHPVEGKSWSGWLARIPRGS